MSAPIFLDEEQVRKHLRMADLIPAMEKALSDFSGGKVIQPVEAATLESCRKEMARRSAAEMDEARVEFRRRNKIWSYFPDEGPLRRELYPNHMKFVGYTKTDEEVMMLAANRCLTPWSPVERVD